MVGLTRKQTLESVAIVTFENVKKKQIVYVILACHLFDLFVLGQGLK